MGKSDKYITAVQEFIGGTPVKDGYTSGKWNEYEEVLKSLR
jgi:hypothetical protein